MVFSPVVAEVDGLAARLADVRQRMRAAALRAGRPADDVVLVAVSKGYTADDVAAAIRLGQASFGENRVQEARAKFGDFEADRTVQLHLIGRLQTNKVLDAVRTADVIQSVDRADLVVALKKAKERLGRMPELFVQVNVGDEPQKSGVATGEADQFIGLVARSFPDALKGLMCIPPKGPDPRPFFDWLAACADRHGLKEVSMGMSDDFEVAIAHGATVVRVGSAIFAAQPRHA